MHMASNVIISGAGCSNDDESKTKLCGFFITNWSSFAYGYYYSWLFSCFFLKTQRKPLFDGFLSDDVR